MATPLVALLLAAPAAEADFGIASFEAKVTHADESDHYEPAGGHPHFGITDILFNTTSDGSPDGNVEDIRVDPPAGLVSNPQALPQCTDAQLASPTGCPPETQLGTEEIRAFVDGIFLDLKVPFYNMTFTDEQVSRFAFNPGHAGRAFAGDLGPIAGSLGAFEQVDIIGGVRWEGDYGVFFTIDDTAASPEVVSSKLTFFAVPASSAHDAERGEGCVKATTPTTPPVTLLDQCGGGGQTSSQEPDVPFLTNPTRCPEQKLTTLLTVLSHNDETVQAPSFTTTRDDGGEGPSNCGDLPFNPSISFTPDTAQPDSPTGPEFNLHVPTDGLLTPGELSTSHVEDVSVTLPPGTTLNPSAANGLEACTDAQLALGTRNPVQCPPASEVGTVEVDTPLLPSPLEGSIFVGQPLPGNLFRVFLVAEGNGVSVRLKGSARPNPSTGQITATFEDNPQQSFENFTLDLEDGSRAVLATPQDCGTKTTTSAIAPYSGTPSVAPSSDFPISAPGCPPGFQPTFGASPASSLAGAFSPLSAQVNRPDRSQFLSGVRVDLPAGFGGMISRVAQCADAQAATGACPASSRVGTVHTQSGAGSEPFPLSGPVYLTGPYKGGSLGLVAVVRAIAGPYDLGTVVVRQAIHVNPVDARLTVVSDPLPRILEGVPIRLRMARVAMDKPGFTYNPTSCGAKRLTSRLRSTLGADVTVGAAPFQIDRCDRLPFAPRLAMRLTGPRQMSEGRHPGVNAVLTQKAGESNIEGARVTLPLSLALDPDNARSLCEYDDGLKGDCPRSSIVGRAKAISPALNRPLTGPVHFVKGVRFGPTGNRIRTLPTFFIPLRGEVPIDLRSQSSIGSRGRLVNTFTSTPDAPVSRFELKLKGGTGAILVVTSRRGACRGRQVAAAHFDGHSGKAHDSRVVLKRPCKASRLRIRKAHWRGGQAVVRGTIAKGARGRVRVTVRCGKRPVVGARKARRGRWKVALGLGERCGSAARARLVAEYVGGDRFRPAKKRRGISREPS